MIRTINITAATNPARLAEDAKILAGYTNTTVTYTRTGLFRRQHTITITGDHDNVVDCGYYLTGRMDSIYA